MQGAVAGLAGLLRFIIQRHPKVYTSEGSHAMVWMNHAGQLHGSLFIQFKNQSEVPYLEAARDRTYMNEWLVEHKSPMYISYHITKDLGALFYLSVLYIPMTASMENNIC